MLLGAGGHERHAPHTGGRKSPRYPWARALDAVDESVGAGS